MAEGLVGLRCKRAGGRGWRVAVDHERSLRLDCDPLQDWVLRLVCTNTHASIRIIAAALQGPRQHRNQLVWE